MSRWRLRVDEENGSARVSLMDGSAVIGVTMMSWHDYTTLCRTLLKSMLVSSRGVISKTLQERLWTDAQATFDNSPELAKIKLAEFGWTHDKINAYADLIAVELSKMMADLLPEAGP